MSTSRVIAFTAVIAAAFAAVPALAGDDPAHPAYHFEPTILVNVDGSTATADSPAPAAPVADSHSGSDDSQYPAANFTPKLLYPDASAK